MTNAVSPMRWWVYGSRKLLDLTLEFLLALQRRHHRRHGSQRLGRDGIDRARRAVDAGDHLAGGEAHRGRHRRRGCLPPASSRSRARMPGSSTASTRSIAKTSCRPRRRRRRSGRSTDDDRAHPDRAAGRDRDDRAEPRRQAQRAHRRDARGDARRARPLRSRRDGPRADSLRGGGDLLRRRRSGGDAGAPRSLRRGRSHAAAAGVSGARRPAVPEHRRGAGRGARRRLRARAALRPADRVAGSAVRDAARTPRHRRAVRARAAADRHDRILRREGFALHRRAGDRRSSVSARLRDPAGRARHPRDRNRTPGRADRRQRAVVGAADEARRPANGALDRADGGRGARGGARAGQPQRGRAGRAGRVSRAARPGIQGDWSRFQIARLAARPSGLPTPNAARRAAYGIATNVSASGLRNYGATGRNQGDRSHAGAGRPVLHDAARRHGRRDREDRGAGARRRIARLGAVRRRLEQLLPRRQPRQEERRAGSENAGGRRRAARADCQGRRAGRELQARQPQPAWLRPARRRAHQPRAHLLLDLRLRPDRPALRRSRATTSSSRAKPASWMSPAARTARRRVRAWR